MTEQRHWTEIAPVRATIYDETDGVTWRVDAGGQALVGGHVHDTDRESAWATAIENVRYHIQSEWARRS